MIVFLSCVFEQLSPKTSTQTVPVQHLKVQMKLCLSFVAVSFSMSCLSSSFRKLRDTGSVPGAQLMRTSSVDALESVVSLGPMLLGMLDTK